MTAEQQRAYAAAALVVEVQWEDYWHASCPWGVPAGAQQAFLAGALIALNLSKKTPEDVLGGQMVCTQLLDELMTEGADNDRVVWN